ncbi:hypothetical protein L0B67_004766 [Salmonella enterica]|nr:hypothetical protein [Salmonella enterica]EIS6494149.1 hypothetical protein [Salmonella enterica]EIS6596611.1 hypothetical protein [Salmonella enterica]EIS6669567.1 hypothetical protein [Salmonella enterica]
MLKPELREFHPPSPSHAWRSPSPLPGDPRVRDFENSAREHLTYLRITQNVFDTTVKSIKNINDLQHLSDNSGNYKFVLNLDGKFRVMIIKGPFTTYINGIAAAAHTVMCNRDDGMVRSAGYINVINTNEGPEVKLFGVSGHYHPRGRHLLPAKQFLENLGVHKDKIKMYEWVSEQTAVNKSRERALSDSPGPSRNLN